MKLNNNSLEDTSTGRKKWFVKFKDMSAPQIPLSLGGLQPHYMIRRLEKVYTQINSIYDDCCMRVPINSILLV